MLSGVGIFSKAEHWLCGAWEGLKLGVRQGRKKREGVDIGQRGWFDAVVGPLFFIPLGVLLGTWFLCRLAGLGGWVEAWPVYAALLIVFNAWANIDNAWTGRSKAKKRKVLRSTILIAFDDPLLEESVGMNSITARCAIWHGIFTSLSSSCLYLFALNYVHVYPFKHESAEALTLLGLVPFFFLLVIENRFFCDRQALYARNLQSSTDYYSYRLEKMKAQDQSQK